MISTEELFRLVKGPVAVAEPLAPYTVIRTGGPADFLVKPRDRADLVRACGYFNGHGLPFFILGNGSTLLVNDNGFRGVAIATQFLDRISIDGEIVEADAGVAVPLLLERIRKASLGGLEQLETVPGSVGGALRRNAGNGVGGIIDSVEWVDILRNGKIRRLKRRELPAGDRSPLAGEEVILGAGFRLKSLSSREKRTSRKPLHVSVYEPASGIGGNGALCVKVFRNRRNGSGAGGDSPAELVRACGLVGKSFGGASISPTDANSIVNVGGAMSVDVLELARLAREEVQARFGVELELELTLVGFNGNGGDESFRA